MLGGGQKYTAVVYICFDALPIRWSRVARDLGDTRSHPPSHEGVTSVNWIDPTHIIAELRSSPELELCNGD